MTSTSIRSVRVRPVRWPLRAPFVTALGRKTHSDNVLVSVTLAGGAEGWGEASSSLAMPWQTGPRMAAALRRMARAFSGRDARDAEKIAAQARRTEPEMPTAAAAFECALVDALCRQERVPFHQFFGGARRDLKTLMSVSAVAPVLVGAKVREGRRRGFDVFKLKLNGREPMALNAARARAAHGAAPRAALSLDPNQSYRPDALEELLDVLRHDGLSIRLVEEPFLKRDWAALKRFKPKATVPVILDESVQSAGDARRAAGLVDGVNVKVAKSGLFGGKDIVREFASSHKGKSVLMIGCMAESSLGLAASVQFAMGLGSFEHCDLDSDLLLKDTGVMGGYVRRGPWLTLPRKPFSGLGVRP